MFPGRRSKAREVSRAGDPSHPRAASICSQTCCARGVEQVLPGETAWGCGRSGISQMTGNQRKHLRKSAPSVDHSELRSCRRDSALARFSAVQILKFSDPPCSKPAHSEPGGAPEIHCRQTAPTVGIICLRVLHTCTDCPFCPYCHAYS